MSGGNMNLHMNPGGIDMASGDLNRHAGDNESIKGEILSQASKLIENQAGGAGTTEHQMVMREVERQYDEHIKGIGMGRAGADSASDLGQQGMQQMRRSLGQSQV